MKAIVKYWREAACLLTFCLFLWTVSRWTTSPPESFGGKYLFLFFSFADVLIFIYLLRWLWIYRWRERFQRLNQRIAERVVRVFARFFEKLMKKWNFGGKKKNIIAGETKIVFESAIFQKEEKKRKKTVKYKHLESDRERLRFLYRSMIVGRIRSGERIRANETPCEIRVRKENTESVEKLFAMYIVTRYDEDAVLNENEIQKLKDSLECEFTIK